MGTMSMEVVNVGQVGRRHAGVFVIVMNALNIAVGGCGCGNARIRAGRGIAFILCGDDIGSSHR